jgi:hypothetical protein
MSVARRWMALVGGSLLVSACVGTDADIGAAPDDETETAAPSTNPTRSEVHHLFYQGGTHAGGAVKDGAGSGLPGPNRAPHPAHPNGGGSGTSCSNSRSC